jgi:hypothetical protein
MTGEVKRSVRRWRGWVLAIACGLELAGGASCVTPPNGIQTIEGKEQEDIPVPKTLELQKSYSPLAAEEANFRSWHGYYRGSGQFGDLPPWYVTEMRKHGWTFLGVDGSESEKRLHFSKGDEAAKIEIYRELDQHLGAFVNIVHAEVHPRGIEDVAFEEHLQSITEGEIKPASFPVVDAESRPVTAGASPGEGHGEPRGTTGQRPPVLDEIDEAEGGK